MTAEQQTRDFGKYLHRVRTEVFGETLRQFSKRSGLSPSYLGKLENAEVPNPRRETVVKLAEKLGMDSDPFLIKAGFIPDQPERSEDDEYLMLLIGTLDDGQRGAVREFIKLVKDTDIRIGRPLKLSEAPALV